MSGDLDDVRDLDETDRRILHELRSDGRISIRELAERAHISRAAAYSRIERLQRAEVITRYSAIVDHDRAGLTTSAFVAMSIRQDSWRGIADHLRAMTFVEHFSLVGGDVDVLVLVRAPDNHALRRVVLEELHNVPGVQATKTWLIFEESDGPGAVWL